MENISYPYVQGTIIHLTEHFCFNTLKGYLKVLFYYNYKKLEGIIFIDENNICKIYSFGKLFLLKDIKIIKILNVLDLDEGSQIKFKYKNKILKGYIHYFHESFFYSNNKILVIDYKNYNKIWIIDISNIVENDYTFLK